MKELFSITALGGRVSFTWWKCWSIGKYKSLSRHTTYNCGYLTIYVWRNWPSK